MSSQFIKIWIGENTDKEGEKDELWNNGENMIYFWTVGWEKRRKEERRIWDGGNARTRGKRQGVVEGLLSKMPI